MEKNKTSFSVLLSLYKKEKPEYLKDALDSIFSQTVKSDDVVLIEDGLLPKELEDIVCNYERHYQELHVVRFEKNRGLGIALNEGLKYCKHEIIARADTDDINHQDRFERQLKFLVEHPEYALVSSWIDEFIDTPHTIHSQRRLPEKPKDIYKYGKHRCPVNHPVAMYHRNAVEKVGGYQTDLFPEDYYLWMKMLKAGYKFYNIQDSLLYFRYHPDTIKKRGGWKYAIDEAKTQWKAYHNLHYLNFSDLCFNISIRFITRIIPCSLRQPIYSSIRKIAK